MDRQGRRGYNGCFGGILHFHISQEISYYFTFPPWYKPCLATAFTHIWSKWALLYTQCKKNYLYRLYFFNRETVLYPILLLYQFTTSILLLLYPVPT